MKAGRQKFEFIGKSHLKVGYCSATLDGTDFLVFRCAPGEMPSFGSRMTLLHLFLLVKLRARLLVAKISHLDHAPPRERQEWKPLRLWPFFLPQRELNMEEGLLKLFMTIKSKKSWLNSCCFSFRIKCKNSLTKLPQKSLLNLPQVLCPKKIAENLSQNFCPKSSSNFPNFVSK